MQIPLVMTVIGKDKPGLIESIARAVALHGGNWLESRMCRLGGEFAGILRIRVEAANEKALITELQGLHGKGLTVTAQPGGEDPPIVPVPAAQLELVGHDRPGIVREISQALARNGVNVEELTTECSSAPMSGEALFRASATLHIPASCNMASLRQELERIAGNLLVDVTLKELTTTGG